MATPNRISSRSESGLSTREERAWVLAELRKRHLHSVAIVTRNYHTHRSGLIYHAAAPDLEIRMVAAPGVDRDARKLIRTLIP